MDSYELLEVSIFFIVLVALIKPLGSFMAKVYQGERTFLSPLLLPCERLLYRLCGIKPEEEMDWKRYAWAMLLFNLVLFAGLFIMLMVQHLLPLNPEKLPAFSWALALNTAISFTTNTNWQAYSGETAASYFTQMAGLTVHNFLSAATGMAVLMAVIRGFVRRKTSFLGNFWVDTTRGALYILLPISLIGAIFLVSQGVIQNFSPYKTAQLVQPITYDKPKLDAAGEQIKDAQGQQVVERTTASTVTIPMGPVASQEVIKELGTNGGGFFNANSAHPFENPTPLTLFFETLLILLIPGALTYTFGVMVGNTRQGWAILGVMLVLLVVSFGVLQGVEHSGNPLLAKATAIIECELWREYDGGDHAIIVGAGGHGLAAAGAARRLAGGRVPGAAGPGLLRPDSACGLRGRAGGLGPRGYARAEQPAGAAERGGEL